MFSARSGINKNQIQVSEVIPITDNGEVIYTIFNLYPRGHIIISNDDSAEPILGYGLESHIDLDCIPLGLKYLLGEYKTEISAAIKQKLVANEKVKNKWKNYLSEDYNTTLKSYTVGNILLETNWDQEYAYNDSCPDDPITGDQCRVGCVGVALGQVLNYWGCRVFPDSSVSYTPVGFSSPLSINFYDQNYNWDDIGNNVVGATDQFLFHCALSVESDFGSSNTSSSIYKARDALNIYFGFNANYPILKTAYTTSAWINLLKGEIDSERPVLYRGQCDTCSFGHTWVVDGYDSYNKFHCNWGWNGAYQNVFYSLDSLTNGNGDFTSDQRAVINIYPKLDACSGLSGTNVVCSSNVSYSVSIPSSASVTWSKSGSLQQVGGNTGTTYTVKAASCSQGGSSTVTATIKNSQGGTFLVRSKNVIVSGPPPSSVSLNITDNLTGQSVQPYNMCPNTTYVLECVNSSSCSTSNYSWTLPYGMSQISASSNWALINTNSSGGGILMVHSATCCSDCGSNVLILTENLSTDGYDCDNYYMMISPNPSNGEVTISILSKNGGNEVKSDFTAPWDVHVVSVDRQVEIIKETKLEGNKYKLNTSGWKQGVYVVQAKYNDKIVEGKLMVK